MALATGVIAADPPSCQSWASVLTVGDSVGGGRLTPNRWADLHSIDNCIMKWTEFLMDAELNDIERFHHLPDGEYLFGKVLHDVRECLTTYRGCIEIIVTKKDDYSATALRLLIHWDSIVADWYTQTLALSAHLGKYDSTSAEWAKHIAGVGKIVQDAAVFQAEIESIAQPEATEEAKQLIRIAKRSTATLNLLVQDIQAENYKRLWTTLKYRELISSDFQ